MADKLENLLKSAVQGNPYGSGNKGTKESIKIDKPMTLKHSLDGGLGETTICNECTEFGKRNNDIYKGD